MVRKIAGSTILVNSALRIDAYARTVCVDANVGRKHWRSLLCRMESKFSFSLIGSCRQPIHALCLPFYEFSSTLCLSQCAIAVTSGNHNRKNHNRKNKLCQAKISKFKHVPLLPTHWSGSLRKLCVSLLRAMTRQ